MGIKWTGEERGRVERVQGLRSSGAAGKHGDRRHKRRRARDAAKRAALEEQRRDLD